MKRLLAWSALGFVLLLGAAGTFTALVWRYLDRPARAASDPPRTIEIEPGLTATRILERLEEEGVITNAPWARLYLTLYLGDPSLKAGEYRFEADDTPREVVDKLIRGEVLTHTVTLIEGMDVFEVVEHLAARGFGRREVFADLVASPELVADLDPEAMNLEGYLFPDTYSFARNTPERMIIAKLVATFREHWTDSIEPRLAGAVGPAAGEEANRSIRDLVILASIVEKETGVESERPLVAGVYSNRLRQGMGLFADPTVIYALKLAGSWDGNLRRVDLEIDSPYNTYRYAGLPPGPICSPGLASLLAAAEPAEVPYLYFVSRNDGSHVFSRTLSEHNRNVERWQRRYWRERWRSESGSGDDH